MHIKPPPTTALVANDLTTPKEHSVPSARSPRPRLLPSIAPS
ncbi:hypothetical protein M6B38_116770 [Iris pallida]|uniref:Uncharacterized protein n=1 Tax=Iris pallida TaxID=29817 RepID=A0AAX6I5H7_IRIPA|nr:hypothetical protein M6B38_289880 [Iris pallida]KAJ6848163.1 hypothetical protein M6B38_116770 [Iris pallida]